MRVMFRADASLSIGSGHVMRCLTLANALNEKGATVEFICRDLPGNLIVYIENKGFTVHSLQGFTTSKPGVSRSHNNLSHSHWLGVSQEQDVKECESVLKIINPDWLIVDHYAIDCWWQNELKGHYKKLMVIDDLADRRHECDLLLDQTFGRKEEEYRSLVPQGCQLLLGSKYALLRPEFTRWREYSLRKRVNPKLKNIFVTMGGVDPDNVTGQVLEILKACDLPKGLNITIVMGAGAQKLNKVKQIAGAMPYKTDVKVNVINMAELMANADLAIGASGTTTWERCCLGLPSIQVVIADNQIAIAKLLSAAGVIKYIEDLRELQLIINGITESCRKMSFIASSITDGRGCEMVCNYVFMRTAADEGVTLKPADINDCEFVYSLQTEAAREYSRNPAKPTWGEHSRWFAKTIESDDSVLFVVTLNKHPAGVLRLDDICGKEIEISIIVAPEYTGRGLARISLLQAIKLQPGSIFKAVIHEDNLASKSVFSKLGFSKVGELGFFNEYIFPNK